MLEFKLESPRRFLLNDIVSLPEPGKVARAVVDRRAAAGDASAASPRRKRRRHDGINSANQAPLEW